MFFKKILFLNFKKFNSIGRTFYLVQSLKIVN